MPLFGETAQASAVEARLEDGGRTCALTLPGFTGFRGGFSATLESGGVTQVLVSSSGMLVGTNAFVDAGTPYGMAYVTLSSVRFEKEQVDLLVRLEKMKGVPVVLLQAGIRNIGDRPVNLLGVSPLSMADAVSTGQADHVSGLLQVSGSPAEWLVTGMNPRTPVVAALGDIGAPLDIFEYGGFYRRDGTGFLFGPVGTPLAYLSARVAALGKGRAVLTLTADMSGVRVGPGQTRWGQQAALFAEPPGAALARWTEWVAKTHGTRVAKGALSGWNSWYYLERDVTGKDVLNVAAAVGKSNGHLRPDVVQIDRYSSTNMFPGAPLEANVKFPEGLPFYAKSIAATGARPGLKLEFQFPPGDTEAIVAEVRRAVQAGFTYLKIGYVFTGDVHGGTDTAFETYRENMKEIRRAAGDDAYILFSGTEPDRAMLGAVDACRTGFGTYRNGVRPVMKEVLRSYQLNGRWFAVDNDAYYMATELKDVSPVVGGWPLARTWISMVGLSCGAAFTSDLWHEERFKPYWRNVEVLTPAAKEVTEVLDLCLSADWPVLVGHVTRAWGGWTVALLWNTAEKEQTVKLDFARIGLNPNKRYAVWSFWDNRYLGVAEGSWTTPFLAPAASQHLCFTELPQFPDKPLLIGSSLHIYCGAAEIGQVTSLRSAMQIELTDAGAREGDLFVYSRFRPVVKEAAGCAVEEIKAAGENVWQISLWDRRHGAAQRVELGIPLPVTRQAWFWLLCTLLACSLLFGAWRYVEYTRLRQRHAVEQERIRIARDIHDDLGTSLTRISVMADSGTADQQDQAGLRVNLAAIRAVTSDMTRAMEEIVWAINPRNDTLESMAQYLSGYAEEFLAPAGLRLRLDVPLHLPPWPLSAEVRHNLFLAFKEALNNLVKHAAAREVQVSLRIEPRRFRIIVRDDGCGLPAAPLTAQAGNGLANMRNRMAKVGGECRITGVPGQGTTVEFVALASSAVTGGRHET